jgi:hypothetical protein
MSKTGSAAVSDTLFPKLEPGLRWEGRAPIIHRAERDGPTRGASIEMLAAGAVRPMRSAAGGQILTLRSGFRDVQ